MTPEPHTHPIKPTLGSLEASPAAKALIDELQDVLRCEELWYIAEKHLKAAEERGRVGLLRELRTSDAASIEEQYANVLADENTPITFDDEETD